MPYIEGRFSTKRYDKRNYFNFPIVDFHLYVVTFQQHLHMEHMSVNWFTDSDCPFHIFKLFLPLCIDSEWGSN